MNTIEITPTQARRLAITKQRLAGPRPDATPEGIVDLVRDLGCLQIDPIRAVERTQYLVLWSRLGTYNPEAPSYGPVERQAPVRVLGARSLDSADGEFPDSPLADEKRRTPARASGPFGSVSGSKTTPNYGPRYWRRSATTHQRPRTRFHS